MPLLVRPFRLGAMMRPYRLGSILDAGPPDAQLVRVPDLSIMPMPVIPRTPMPPQYLGPPVPAPAPPGPGQICPSWGCGAPPVRTVVTCPPGVMCMQGGPGVQIVPTSDGTNPVTAVSTLPAPGSTVVVTPTSGPIPPPSTPIIPASSPGIFAWLQGSMFGGIPNWVLAAGAAAFLLSGGGKSR